MGLLFSKIWSLFNDEEHKIIVVGLDNAGKTTILYQLLMNEVVHTSPTIGSNVEEVNFGLECHRILCLSPCSVLASL